MAETEDFRGQNKVLFVIIHLSGKMKLRSFLVHCNQRVDLLAYEMPIVKRR